MAVNYWMLVSWVLVFVVGFLFLAFILFYSLSGRYGKEIVKAKLGGKKLMWFIDNHNDVHPRAVRGEAGYRAGKFGTFIPDPDNAITTGDVKGSLHDTNLSPAICFNLLKAVKKLSRFDVKGRSDRNGGIEAVIMEQKAKVVESSDELHDGLLTDFQNSVLSADETAFSDKIEKFNQFYKTACDSLDNSDLPEDVKAQFKDLIVSEFDSLYNEIMGCRSSDEYAAELQKRMISVVQDYSSEINALLDDFRDEISLSDPEIKALRNYYALVQPQYVERKVNAGVNEATAGQKDLTKVFIYVCGGVGIVILAIAFFVMLVGGNDPTVIIQNASDAVANNTTQLPL